MRLGLPSRAQYVPSSFPLVTVNVNTDTKLGCSARDNIHELIALLCRLVQPVKVVLMVYDPVLC